VTVLDGLRRSAIVRFLQRQPWAGALFTAGTQSGQGTPIQGREPGTFALELVHIANAERGPDIVLTLPWTSGSGPFGLPGADYIDARATELLTGTAGNHGSMSPWVVRNTFLARGHDFKHGVTVRTPASNVDLAPTLLALMNLDTNPGPDRFDGRALREAFADGPDEEQVPVEVHTYFVETADGAIAPQSKSPSWNTSATSTRTGEFGETTGMAG
jgi:hypothetical protein